MAEYRQNHDAMTWLTLKADDATVSELDKSTLTVLEERFGTEALPDVVEDRLRSRDGVDFATASDEQIFDTTNELAIGGTDPVDQHTSVEPAEPAGGGDVQEFTQSLPQAEELAAQIATDLGGELAGLAAASPELWSQVSDEELMAAIAEEIRQTMEDIAATGWTQLREAAS